MIDLKAYENLTARQQLNLFRGLYYNDGNTTEKGIIANAINEILPEYFRQKAEIESLKELNKVLETDNINANMNLEHITREYDEMKRALDIYEETSGAKKVRADAIRKFADILHTEIHQALASNYKARNKRQAEIIYTEGNEFISYCEGKISALRGIDDFIDETYKEMTGGENEENQNNI